MTKPLSAFPLPGSLGQQCSPAPAARPNNEYQPNEKQMDNCCPCMPLRSDSHNRIRSLRLMLSNHHFHGFYPSYFLCSKSRVYDVHWLRQTAFSDLDHRPRHGSDHAPTTHACRPLLFFARVRISHPKGPQTGSALPVLALFPCGRPIQPDPSTHLQYPVSHPYSPRPSCILYNLFDNSNSLLCTKTAVHAMRRTHSNINR